VLSVAKVNVDENRDLALDFGITSLPTIAVFKGGDLIERFIGMRSKKALLADLAAYLTPR
jgi:thioredoxin 1